MNKLIPLFVISAITLLSCFVLHYFNLDKLVPGLLLGGVFVAIGWYMIDIRFRLFGTDLILHKSLLLIFVFFSFISLIAKEYALIPKLIAPYLFVTIHEYCHVFVAKKYGYYTKEILMTFFGGAARMNIENVKPKEEFNIAVIGPLSNIAMALLFMIPIFIFGFYNSLLIHCLFVNVAIAAFNMVPVYPMDGGRILRSLISLNFSFKNPNKVCFAVSTLFMIFSFNFFLNYSLYAYGIIAMLYILGSLELLPSKKEKEFLMNDEDWTVLEKMVGEYRVLIDKFSNQEISSEELTNAMNEVAIRHEEFNKKHFPELKKS